MMRRLKPSGRAAVVLPNSILEATSGVKKLLKEKLFNEFNVHTIIRLPNDVFAPYTNIQTNLIFFENNGPTKETWIYRMDKPDGYKHFSKTKPILLEHFADTIEWWNNRKELLDSDGNEKAKCYKLSTIAESSYNLNLCGFPEIEEEIFDPFTTINNYRNRKKEIDSRINEILSEIEVIINGK